VQNNISSDLWQLIGRLHPLIVHFPISLLWVGLLLECIAWRKKSDLFQPAIAVILWVGTISALLAVGFGLVLSNQEEYLGNLISLHQWSGIATAFLSGLTLYTFSVKEHKSFRLLLFLTVIGVSVAGHFGAQLTHGENYLSLQKEKAKSIIPLNASLQVQDLTGKIDTKQKHDKYLGLWVLPTLYYLFQWTLLVCVTALKVKRY
jgi:uncharacterized membrane protein